MNNAETIQILVVAARASAANRLLSDLRQDGTGVRMAAAADLGALKARLAEGPWDALVCFEGDGAPAAEQVLGALAATGVPLPCLVVPAPGATLDGSPRNTSSGALDANSDGAANATRGSSALLRLGARDIVAAEDHEKLAFALRREVERQALGRRARLLEMALRELEHRHRLLLDGSHDAIAYVREGVHLYCNPAYAAIFGHSDVESVRRTPLLDLVAEEDRGALREWLGRPLDGECRQSLRGRGQNGAGAMLDLGFTPVEIDGEPSLQVCVKPAAGNPNYAREVAEIETRDLLTRLHNLPHFMKKLEHAIGAALRQRKSGALLLVSLNEFLDIESAVGRTGANLILADISRFLQESASKAYIAARLSAHEFGLLLYDGDPGEALRLAEFIRGKINGSITSAALPALDLSCSVGIALINENALDAASVVARARANLGFAPPAGEGYLFRVGDTLTPGMNGLLDYLGQALDQDRVKLLFQPVVSLKGESFKAYDVLTRLLDSDGNEIPPAVFIPLLNLEGLGERFDRAVVAHALRLLEKAEAGGTLVIKLTGSTLVSRTFLPWLNDCLRERRALTDRIAFQVSEVELHRNPRQVSAFCRGLQELNLLRVVTHFGCALDPFRLLADIRPAYVILDESLFRDIVYSGQQKRNVQTLVDDLHRQGYMAGAPRVEDMDLLPMLWDIGVDVVQGYCLQGPSQEMNYEFTQEQEITLGAIPGQ